MAIARGNEKGRVERGIRYVRDAFVAARRFTGLDDLNAQAEAWCFGEAADRRCPGQENRRVCEVFAEEVPRLLALPDPPYPLLEQVTVRVGKTPYIRFDLNDYSVPHTQVQRTLTVLADPHEVRITDGSRFSPVMQSRENITQAPDLIASIQVNPGMLIVRTVLLPHMPYANARVAVKRHDQLPHWLLDAWHATSMTITARQIEDPNLRRMARNSKKFAAEKLQDETANNLRPQE